MTISNPYSIKLDKDSYVELTHHDGLNISSNAITLEAWVCKTEPNSTWQRVIAKQYTSVSTANNCYEIGLANDKVRFAIGNIFDITGGITLPLNKWHHIAGTFDGATANIYLNGELLLSHKASGKIRTSAEPLAIGIAKFKDNINYGLIGNIDEARVWDRALSQDEISENMNMVIKPNTKNLVSYFRFDEGQGVEVRDEVTGSNAMIVGSYSWEMGEVTLSLAKKMLVVADGSYYKFDETSGFTLVGHETDSIEDRESMFIQHGMDGRISPTKSQFLELGGTGNISFDVLITEESGPTELRYTAIPNDKLILPNKDINISNVYHLDSFTLKSLASGSGDIRVIVSFDTGENWYAWDNTRSEWVKVETTPEDVKSKGMVSKVLNIVPSDAWNDLRNESNNVRFGYLLSIESEDDTAYADELFTQFDMQGSWKHYKDADWEYSSNTILQISVYEDGDYKINY